MKTETLLVDATIEENYEGEPNVNHWFGRTSNDLELLFKTYFYGEKVLEVCFNEEFGVTRVETETRFYMKKTFKSVYFCDDGVYVLP